MRVSFRCLQQCRVLAATRRYHLQRYQVELPEGVHQRPEVHSGTKTVYGMNRPFVGIGSFRFLPDKANANTGRIYIDFIPRQSSLHSTQT